MHNGALGSLLSFTSSVMHIPRIDPSRIIECANLLVAFTKKNTSSSTFNIISSFPYIYKMMPELENKT
jgi:hypothetical protein